MLALRFRSWVLLQFTLNRRRMSNAAGPQSSAMEPVAGVANAPSVLFRFRPKEPLTNICMRRQFQRGGSGALVAGPVAVALLMTLVRTLATSAALVAIVGAPDVTLKFTAAPMLSECCREAASPVTSMTLANSGSGRTP